MTGFIKVILFIILFMIIMRLVRLISRFRSSSKQSIDDLREKHSKESEHFKDVEEADFKDIPSENEKESEDNLN